MISIRHVRFIVACAVVVAVAAACESSVHAYPSLLANQPRPSVDLTRPVSSRAPDVPAFQTGDDALARLPAAPGLGPPAWVQPGTRLTWFGQAASVAQSYYTYVEDEAGDWEDPTTGKRYRRTDESGEEMPTAAGEAYAQTDVVAVDGTDVVVSTSLYSIDMLANRLALTPLGGSRMRGVAVDGAWIHPDVLRQIGASGLGDLMVLRGRYALGDSTYDAISFVSRSDKAYQSSTYDTASGVLLAMNSSTEGAGSPVHGPLDDPQGNVQLSWTRLVGVRQLAAPGIGAPIPAWVATTSGLAYSGDTTVVNPYDQGATFTWPTRLAVTFTERGTTWASFTSRTEVDSGGSPQVSDAAGVAGPTGLYWYDPSALAAMTTGQVLDEDPVTQARVSVESIEGSLVTLATETNGVTARLAYDRASGVLESLRVEQAVTGITTSLRLASGP